MSYLRARERARALPYLLAGVFLFAWLATASPAAAVTVEAQTSYHENYAGEVSGVRMEIFRDGRRVVNRRPPKPCGYCALIPAEAIELDHPVSVIQLDDSPEPEVVFDFWTGGAHCCVVSFIFHYDSGAGSYESFQHDFYDFGYRFADPDGNGQFVFQGWDWRFGYRFGCFGPSAGVEVPQWTASRRHPLLP
jgi:hypothetical protein